jgi:hypothetical protein
MPDEADPETRLDPLVVQRAERASAVRLLDRPGLLIRRCIHG